MLKFNLFPIFDKWLILTRVQLMWKHSGIVSTTRNSAHQEKVSRQWKPSILIGCGQLTFSWQEIRDNWPTCHSLLAVQFGLITKVGKQQIMSFLCENCTSTINSYPVTLENFSPHREWYRYERGGHSGLALNITILLAFNSKSILSLSCLVFTFPPGKMSLVFWFFCRAKVPFPLLFFNRKCPSCYVTPSLIWYGDYKLFCLLWLQVI